MAGRPVLSGEVQGADPRDRYPDRESSARRGRGLEELKAKKDQLQAKLQSLEQMKKDGTISDKVYKDKKKDTEKDIQQVERDIVDSM